MANAPRNAVQLLCRSGSVLLGLLGAALSTLVRGASALRSRIKRSRVPTAVAANQAGTSGPVPAHRPHVLRSFAWWVLSVVVTGLLIALWSGTWLAERQAAREQRAILQQLGHIAYVRNGDIWLCRGDGSRAWPLVAGAECRGLAWSPDGRRLAFVRSVGMDEKSTVALYVADLESGELIKYSDDIPGVATSSDVVCAGRHGTLTAIAFDYEEIDKSPVYAPCLARVSMAEYCGKSVEILPHCHCPWLDATGKLYAMWEYINIIAAPDPWTASMIADGDGDARREIIASDEIEELEGAGLGICTIALSPSADEVVFRAGLTGAGQLRTVGSWGGTSKKLCDLGHIMAIGWNPSGTHLLLRQEVIANYHGALPSTEGLVLMERTTGLFRQLLTRPREGYWHFSRQCWSHDGQWLLVTHADYDRKEDEWPIVEPMFLNVQTNERISVSIPLVDDPRLYLQPTATPIRGKPQWRFDSSGDVSDGRGVSHREELSKPD